MAYHDVRTIHAAILRYFREYGSWPTATDPIRGDAHYGGRTPNAEVIRILRAMPAGSGMVEDLNPQRIVFLEVKPYRRGLSGVDTNGSFLDPWGTPYQIALDADFDDSVAIAPNSPIRLSGVGCAVRSFGPDRKPDTRDDLTSWRREEHGAQSPWLE